MRYVITPTQFHNLVYGYLNKMFGKKDFRKDVIDDGDWRIDMFDDKERELISYFWYGPGEYDDGTPHNGIGSLHVNPKIVDFIRSTFSMRESKVLDIIADWVSETLGVDIDEITVFPKRTSPPNY
jgi:hypothetical protein